MGGRLMCASAGLAVALLLAACGGEPPGTGPTPGVAAPLPARDSLAGLAAAAKDKRYVATYTLSAAKRPDRTVTVAVATDGSWIVAVPGGALDGLADVAVFRSAKGLFQCALGPAAGSAGARPDLAPVTPGCVRVRRLAASTDPRVQHIFTDWIDPLVDRATALSVAAAPRLRGARGSCYSVESNSAALSPPVDPGVYCYARDGVLTGARVAFGTITLAGAVAPAPSTVAMPAPVVQRDPVAMKAPPSPTASPEP